MRWMIKIMVVVFPGIILLSSCGMCRDHVKPSPKSVVFGPQADSVTITTKSAFWRITGVTLNDSVYRFNIQQDSMKGCCFSVAKRGTTLFVKLGENNTGKERLMVVSLEAGDCFYHINVKQLAK